MKIRTGFVGNSSSSSFCVNIDKNPEVYRILLKINDLVSSGKCTNSLLQGIQQDPELLKIFTPMMIDSNAQLFEMGIDSYDSWSHDDYGRFSTTMDNLDLECFHEYLKIYYSSAPHLSIKEKIDMATTNLSSDQSITANDLRNMAKAISYIFNHKKDLFILFLGGSASQFYEITKNEEIEYEVEFLEDKIVLSGKTENNKGSVSISYDWIWELLIHKGLINEN